MTDIDRRQALKFLAAAAAGSKLALGEHWASALPALPLAEGPKTPGTSNTPTEAPPELRTRLTDHFGVAYPVIQAGLGFYAVPELAAAVSNAGGIGCLGAVPEDPEGVRKMIRETKRLTSRPFGIDYVYFPMFGATPWGPDFEKDKEHYQRSLTWTCNDDHIDVLAEEGIDFVVFFWTNPEARWVKKLKKAGIQLWQQVGSTRGAREAVEWGADGVIAQGYQAGGHVRGYQDGRPMLRLDLIPRVKAAIPPGMLLVASGGVGNGKQLGDTLLAGAEGAWCGTVFTASAESHGHDKYKEMVIGIEDGWEETTMTQLFGPEWPRGYMRVARNRVVREWGQAEDLQTTPPPPPAVVGTCRIKPWSYEGGIPYAMPKFSLAIPSRSTEGDFEEMPILCGADTAPLVKSVRPAAEVLTEMVTEARAYLAGKR
jgi:enoyl-[acyl-carrier protein] reductase II